MELKIIKVSEIQEHEMNPRKTIEEAYKRLVQDVKDNKQRKLIKSAVWVVELEKGGYRLMDGHHRLRAYKEAGVEECPAMVVFESEYDEREQLADLVTMNKQVASFDTYKLGEVINAINAKGIDIPTLEKKLGYSSGEVEKLLKLTKVDFDALDKARPTNPDNDEGDLGNMGDAGDKGDAGENDYGSEKVEFMLTEEEIMLVDQAISRVLEEDPNMSRGRALELICADYEAGA